MTMPALILLLLFSSLLYGGQEDRTVSVLYAGSLGGLMENGVGPAFMKATGFRYAGEAQGSLGAARMIREHIRTPDVFISADPAVNETVLMGANNSHLVKWFFVFASSQLVLGYSPRSRFAADFRNAAANKIPWYQVLETPGVRFGRGDPTIDPKGYRTLFLFQLASRYYHKPDLLRLLGDATNTQQVYPEIVLMGRVESGQLDAGVFYRHEAIANKLPYVPFPPEINLGDPRFAVDYKQVNYTTAKGERIAGAPILLTVTIPATVRRLDASLAFVKFLLGCGQLLEQYGLHPVECAVGGDLGQVPEQLKPFNSGVFRQ